MPRRPAPPPVPALDGITQTPEGVLLKPSRAQRRGIGRVATVAFAAVVVVLLLLLGPGAAIVVLALTISTAGALAIVQRGTWVRLADDAVVVRTWPRTRSTAWSDVRSAEVVENGRLAQVRLTTTGGTVVLPVPARNPLANDPTFPERAAFVVAWCTAKSAARA